MPGTTTYPRGSGRRKLGPWVGIDFTHPLARGLAECYLCTGNGAETRDAATRDLGVLTNGPLIVGTPYGLGIQFDGTNDYVTTSPARTLGQSDANPVAVDCLIQPLSTMTTRQSLYSRNNVAGTIGIEVGIGAGTSSTPGRVATQATGNGFNSSTNNNAISKGNWYHIIYTHKTAGATHEIDINGVPQTLLTNDANVNYIDSSAVRLLGVRAAANQMFNGIIVFLRVWRRYLTIAERQWLYREPYAFVLQPGPRRFFLGPSTGPPPSVSDNPAAILAHL